MTIRHEWKNFEGIPAMIFMAGEATPSTPKEAEDKPVTEVDTTCDAGQCNARIEKAEIDLKRILTKGMKDLAGAQGETEVTKGDGWTKYAQPLEGGEKIVAIQNSNGALKLFVQEANGFMRQVPIHTEGIKTAMSTTDADDFLGTLIMAAEHTKSGIRHALGEEARVYKLGFERTVDGQNEFYKFKNAQGETLLHVHYDAERGQYRLITHDERGENVVGKPFSADQYENLSAILFGQVQKLWQKELAARGAIKLAKK